jgi:hypothetical protein
MRFIGQLERFTDQLLLQNINLLLFRLQILLYTLAHFMMLLQFPLSFDIILHQNDHFDSLGMFILLFPFEVNFML